MSPDALYERGIDAITGVGERTTIRLGIDYFRRSPTWDMARRRSRWATTTKWESWLPQTRKSGSLRWIFTKRLPNKAIRWLRGWQDGVIFSAMEFLTIWIRRRMA